MLGHQSEGALLALFRESAIYLCCSAYEPFGLAPLEAALCGCAIVANAIPTLHEVWDDAALYFDGSADDLTRLLKALSEHPDDLAAAQRRSMERAQRYSTARMTEGYLQQMNTLLAERAGAEAFAA